MAPVSDIFQKHLMVVMKPILAFDNVEASPKMLDQSKLAEVIIRVFSC